MSKNKKIAAVAWTLAAILVVVNFILVASGLDAQRVELIMIPLAAGAAAVGVVAMINEKKTRIEN